jgi:Leucine-rich repeat (LRR) protein
MNVAEISNCSFLNYGQNSLFQYTRGYHANHLKTVRFQSSDRTQAIVHYLPLDLYNYPGITKLIVFECGLKEITSANLQYLKNLEILSLPGNQLTSLPDDLFVHTPKISRIDFSRNQIDSISSRLLDSIPPQQWKKIDFRGNKKIDACYNPDDFLKTVQELKFLIDSPSSTPSYSTQIGKLTEIWETRKFCDIAIVVGSKEIPVHKSVLAVQSPVFSELFEKDEQVKATNKLEIKGCSEEAVEEFLHSLYTGKVTNFINALEVISLACTFDAQELKQVYEDLSSQWVNDGNALEALKVGNVQGSQKIIDVAFGKLKEKFPNEIKSDVLKKNPEIVEKILKKFDAITKFKDQIESIRTEIEEINRN